MLLHLQARSVCTILGLVEKLCMQCSWLIMPSHTFRLLTKRQSETIPRCPIAPVAPRKPRGAPTPPPQAAKAKKVTPGDTQPHPENLTSTTCTPNTHSG